MRFKGSIPYLLDLIYALCVFVSIHVRIIKISLRYLDFSLNLKQFHVFFIAIPVAYCGIAGGACYVYETWINTVGGPILTSISISRPWIGSCHDLWLYPMTVTFLILVYVSNKIAHKCLLGLVVKYNFKLIFFSIKSIW